MAKKKGPESESTDDNVHDEIYDEPEVSGEEGIEETAEPEDDEDAVLMESPPEDEALGPGLDEEVVQAESEFVEDIDDAILQVKSQIEAKLAGQVETAAASGVIEADGVDLIQGVGIGSAELDADQIGSDGPGTQTANIYVTHEASEEDVRRILYDSYSVKAVSDDSLPVNVLTTGFIDTQPHRHRQRPSPCGISVGHFRVTAGTQGILATGRRRPRSNRLLMISNNHVIAASNGGRFGDAIIQPGRVDGGRNPRDRIAILERYVPIDFRGRANYVDCATAWCWPRRVRRDFIYRSRGRFRYFRVSSQISGVRRGMIVGKSGRTTQLTAGRVVGISETIRVHFGGGRFALYRDQISVRGLRGNFSAPGDSGSAIWTWDRHRRPVGLLFAGGGGFTFANKIGRVMRALDVRLIT